MAVRGGEDAYFTLLLSDDYLPGALVLAHSLRDAGTKKKLAVMVTLDSVAAEVITQLKAVYDYVFPVPRIQNAQPANLYLMNRPDLHSAFTKVNLWKQTQFRKIVYLDADVVAYRAPDELFAIEHAFSAAPDIGWPDLFNTGVMVLTPNMGDYYALMAMAQHGISFDGADQGLLNMHFQHSYNRLPFTYNVTPSAHYQYVPAYRHFQSSINLVHFIGSDKPWLQGRSASTGSGPFDQIVGRWWAVYDRHYRVRSPQESKTKPQPPELVQYFVKGEYQPTVAYVVPTGEPGFTSTDPQQTQTSQQYGQQPVDYHYTPSSLSQHTPHAPHEHHHHHHDAHHYAPPQHGYQSEPPAQRSEDPHFEGTPAPPANPSSSPRVVSSSFSTSEEPVTEARPDQVQEHRHWAPSAPAHKEPQQEKPQPPPMEPSWDAQRHPPPPESRPEAINFPQTHYAMSSDVAPFVPPERYPSPPRGMWYDVPKERPAPPREKPRPIFPWEEHRPQATRVFAGEPEPSATEGSTATPSVSSVSEQKSEPVTPTTPTLPVGPPVPAVDPWATFSLTNAWDDVPEIERYVDKVQSRHHRRGKASLGSGSGLRLGPLPAVSGEDAEFRRRGSRLTDFPSEVERPSLPVTPAPIRRPRFWGGGDGGHLPGSGHGDEDDAQLLPYARGVPAQSDWDPVEQLQKLAKQQSELLLQKFGGGAIEGNNVERGLIEGGTGDYGLAGGLVSGPPGLTGEEETTVLSPKPVKPGSAISPVQRILGGNDEQLPGAPARLNASEAASAAAALTTTGIPEPSYHGPGVAWEKGEDVPLKETPMPPTEEEMDVLQT